MICFIIHEIWTFAIGFVKTCSATLLFTGNVPRGVFANKVHRKRESEREILRMHEFCVTRNVLL